MTVDEAGRQAIAVGKPQPAPPGDGPWAMVTETGTLLAVYEPFADGLAKPAVVLPTATD